MIIPNSEIREQVFAAYRAGGWPSGSKTGWPSLDPLYTVAEGQWTLITGLPHSGKSEWLDALLVNLARADKWMFAIYSPENWPLALHHAKIAEKYLGKPFGPGPTARMDEDDLDAAETWMADKFCFCKPEAPNIWSILEEAQEITRHHAIRKTAVIIDPWNQLDHSRPQGQTETEYISATLTMAIEWTRREKTHLFIVAHPAKLFRDREGKRPIPTPSDVSGSAHWWAKADNCICVHRDQTSDTQDVEIYVQKVRFKHIGRIGQATLRYDRVTGRYAEKTLRSIANYYQEPAA